MEYEEAKKRGLTVFKEPRTIRLDPINICTRKCEFCGYKFLNKQEKIYIDKNIINKIVQEIPELKRIILGFNNEPLLHPNIIEVIQNFRQLKNLSICMISNGDLIINNSIKLLDLFLNGLNVLMIDIYDERALNYWNGNAESIKEKGIQIKNYYETNYLYKSSGGKEKILVLCNAINFTLKKKAVRNWHTYGGTIPFEYWREGSLLNYPIKKQCLDPLKFLNISSNGNIPICCRDMSGSTSIGNIYKDNLKDIWTSNKNRIIQYILKAGRRDLIPCCFFCSTLSQRVGLYPYIGKDYSLEEIKLELDQICKITINITHNQNQWKVINGIK